MFTKKLLILMLLCIGLVSCSNDDDNPKTNSPITNLEIPQSSSDNPIKSGESITIKGEGFTQTSEIWLKVITKSTENQDVKAEVSSVTASGISFTVPNVSGERSIVLKQSGQEYILGKMYFDVLSETIVKKRITQWLKDGKPFFEFVYNKDGRLEKFNEAGDAVYTFTYNDAGQLTSVTESDYSTKTKTATTVFEYKNATTIVVTKTDIESSETDIQTLTLNEKGQLIKRVTEDQTNEFGYDASGNIIKNIDSWLENGKTISQILTYDYDAKHSYLSNMNLPVWFWVYNETTGLDCYSGSNNMIKGYKNEEVMDSFKFDYDEEGYPTVIYEDEEGKGNFTKEFELVYEAVK